MNISQKRIDLLKLLQNLAGQQMEIAERENDKKRLEKATDEFTCYWFAHHILTGMDIDEVEKMIERLSD